MSLCTWFVELLYGKKEVGTIAGAEEVKPEAEMFCRSNRRDTWTKRIYSDMIATGADLVCISTPGNLHRYRGVLFNHKLKVWDVVTLAEVELGTLWSNGGARGCYKSSREIDDHRSRYEPHKKMMKEYEIVGGFINEVTYCKGMYGNHHTGFSKHYYLSIGINVDHLRMVEEFNTDKRYRVATLPNGTQLFRTVPQMVQQNIATSATSLFTYTTQTGESITIPNWVMGTIKQVQLVDADGNDTVLADPIKITKLDDGEDVGKEAYIYLVEGTANTYTRARYRIEVESERIFGGKIVDVDALLESIFHRMCFQQIDHKGKLFIDHIQYLCLDGTTHTADVGGFLSIGAEAYRAGRTQAGVHHGSHGHTYLQGPLIVTHVAFPEEPIY
jgi:hypothetical protein